jgi:hypothetical protein
MLAYQSTQQARAKHHDEALRAAPVPDEEEADHVEAEVKPAATSVVRPETVSGPRHGRHHVYSSSSCRP